MTMSAITFWSGRSARPGDDKMNATTRRLRIV
jgi:hypothetical protein